MRYLRSGTAAPRVHLGWTIPTLLAACGSLTILMLPLAGLAVTREPISVTPPNLMLVTFLCLYLANGMLARHWVPGLSSGQLIVLGFFVSWILIARLGAPYGAFEAGVASPFLGSILLLPVGAYMGRWSRSLSWEVPLCIGAVSCAIFGIGHWSGAIPQFAFERQATPRSLGSIELDFGFAGLISARGDYGMWAVGGAMVLSRWMRRRGWMGRVLCTAAYVVLAIGLVMTLSRTSWITFATFTVSAILLVRITGPSSPSARTYRIAYYLLAAPFALLSVITLDVVQRVFGVLVAMQPMSYAARLHGFDLALKAARLNPLFGIGTRLNAIGINYDFIIHNTFLFTLAAFGVPALLLLVWVIATPVFNVGKLALSGRLSTVRAESAIWIAAMLAILVQMSMFSGIMSKFFWVLIGLLSGETSRNMERLRCAGSSEPRETPENAIGQMDA